MRRAELLPLAGALFGALFGALLLTGCALPALVPGTGPQKPVFIDPAMTVETAAQAVVLGTDRQAAQARLGPAETLAFDSGYEVWVYRARGQADDAEGPELVLLFDPQGRLSKLRVKPPYRGRPP